MPAQLICVAYHRRFVYMNHRPFKQSQPQLLSSPIILSLPSKPTGFRIYEEVWSIAHNILQKNCEFLQDHNLLWWNQKNWKNLLSEGRNKQLLSPFVLKIVDRQGFSCPECNWVQKCSGCIIEPDTKLIPDFLKKCHIAIEWNSEMIEQQYNPTSNEIMRHSSINQFQDDLEEQIVSLEKCLQKFHDVEKLTDKTYCSYCKDHKDHQKQFQLFRPPPVLTIQLKRFRQIQQNKWRKQQTLVEFPFYNLDVSNFVQDFQFLAGQDISCQYDLCGIINHYGSLTYGHYTSVVKNPFDNQWYRYDDQHRTLILESQIQKDNAYILFYIRKDINYKQINEIFPSIDELFPGKPVKTKFGQGFILGKKPPDKNQPPIVDKSLSQNFYYVKIKQDIYEINESHILPDKDKNEINIDKQKLEEIAQQQVEESNNTKKKEDEQKQSGFKLISTILFCSQKQKNYTQVSSQQNQDSTIVKQVNGQEIEMIKQVASVVSPVANKNNQIASYPKIQSNQYSLKENLENLQKENLENVQIENQDNIQKPPIIQADIDGPNDQIDNNQIQVSPKKKKKKKKKILKITENTNPDEFF